MTLREIVANWRLYSTQTMRPSRERRAYKACADDIQEWIDGIDSSFSLPQQQQSAGKA